MKNIIKNMYSIVIVNTFISIGVNMYATYQLTIVKKESEGRNIRLNAMYDLIYELMVR